METIWVSLLALLYLTPAIASVVHALLTKRDSRAALGWIMACIFVPYGGPVAYFFFGINRVRTRARDLRKYFGHARTTPGETAELPPPEPGIEAVGHYITGQSLTDGNTVDVFHNGDEAYPDMLDAIAAARHRVFLATFILKTDTTGKAFIKALRDAVDRGVDVRVLVDGFGELYSWHKPSRLLKDHGINVGRFLPPRLIPPSIYVNLRNHRKLLVVDNTLAFAGGMNISDYHTNLPNKPRTVTDVHFSLRGPIIDELAKIFTSDWLFTTREMIEPMEPANAANPGRCRCRAIPDGPDDKMDALALTIQGVISGARESVDIMTPYFLPSRELTASLLSASLRGVRVRLVLPGKNNLFYVHWANRHYLPELVERGIEVYYQPPPFSHSKLLCVDEDYCLIGSANLDPRSLRLNFELGVEVVSSTLGDKLRRHVADTVAGSHRITAEELAGRSRASRLRDAAVSLMSPYL